jgi:hypothetical protein
MSVNTQSRFDGIVDRGSIIFENQVKAQVAGLDPQAFIAIDVDSGDFEVATEDWDAFDKLHARCPEALVYFRRVGSDVGYFLGGTEPA